MTGWDGIGQDSVRSRVGWVKKVCRGRRWVVPSSFLGMRFRLLGRQGRAARQHGLADGRRLDHGERDRQSSNGVRGTVLPPSGDRWGCI